MNVESHLGLGSVSGAGLLGQAQHRWAGWVRDFPDLGRVQGPLELRQWLRTKPEDGRGALLGLATLAAVDGWDDPAAAAVLAWTLLPGANALAYRLRDLGSEVPVLVAGQLWIAVRTFPWRTARSVATCVLTTTRRAVLAEAVPHRQVQLWGEGFEQVAEARGNVKVCGVDHSGPTAAQELLEVLQWAQASEVISVVDLQLLVCLIQVATALPDGRRGARQGLLTRQACDMVADACGIGPHTVRRRVGASVDALAAVAGRIDA